MNRRLRPSLHVGASLSLALSLALVLLALAGGRASAAPPPHPDHVLVSAPAGAPDEDTPCEAEGDRDDSAGRDAAVLLHAAPHVDSLPRLESGPVVEVTPPSVRRSWTPVIDRGPPSHL